MYCSRLLRRILWSVDATQDELVYVQVANRTSEPFEIRKFGFYGHRTGKCESLEKKIVQGCVPDKVRKYISWLRMPALDR